MTNIHKRLITGMLISVCSFLFLFAINPNSAISSQDAEETADMVLATDTVTVGKMNEYTNDMIKVNGYEYALCKELKVFNNHNKKIPFQDIYLADKVKIFENDIDCVRKIKVLGYAL